MDHEDHEIDTLIHKYNKNGRKWWGSKKMTVCKSSDRPIPFTHTHTQNTQNTLIYTNTFHSLTQTPTTFTQLVDTNIIIIIINIIWWMNPFHYFFGLIEWWKTKTTIITKLIYDDENDKIEHENFFTWHTSNVRWKHRWTQW